MKTVIEQQQAEWKFPCLAKNIQNGFIALMHSLDNDGMKGVVIIESENYEIGFTSTVWDSRLFTPITTPLTITFIPELCTP